MAKSKNTTPVFSQDKPIRRVALYARVSTLHGQQDPANVSRVTRG